MPDMMAMDWRPSKSGLPRWLQDGRSHSNLAVRAISTHSEITDLIHAAQMLVSGVLFFRQQLAMI